MNTLYNNTVANCAAEHVRYIGLYDQNGIEIPGIRQPVEWTPAVDGIVRPTQDLVFNITEGITVAGWRGFSAETGGIEYGGGALKQETLLFPGMIYTLEAHRTGIRHIDIGKEPEADPGIPFRTLARFIFFVALGIALGLALEELFL